MAMTSMKTWTASLTSEMLLLINDQDDFVVLALRGKMDLSKVFKMCSNVHIKGI